MKRWECTMCGYIHEGEEAPLGCPICNADKEKFFKIGESEETVKKEEPEKDIKDTQPENPSQEELSLVEKITALIVDNHLHAITVHSPNGIVPVSVVFLVILVLFQCSNLESAIFFNMVAVLLSMPLVIFTGYVTWQKKYKGVKTSIFKIKIAASSVATVILFGLVVWRIIQPEVLSSASLDRWLFLIWSLILLAAVGLAGYFGGRLVFARKS